MSELLCLLLELFLEKGPGSFLTLLGKKLPISINKPHEEVHICNSSYVEGLGRRITV
jgi:hypothetical protein